jgi:hypothetical protein
MFAIRSSEHVDHVRGAAKPANQVEEIRFRAAASFGGASDNRHAHRCILSFVVADR